MANTYEEGSQATETVKGGAGRSLDYVAPATIPGVFNPNDPTSAIMQQQISGVVPAVSTTHTNTITNPAAQFAGAVASGAVGTTPVVTTPANLPPPVAPVTAPAQAQTPYVDITADEIAAAQEAQKQQEDLAKQQVQEVAKPTVSPVNKTSTGTTKTGTGTGTQTPTSTVTPTVSGETAQTLTPTVTGVTSGQTTGSTADTSQSAQMLTNVIDSQKDLQNKYMEKLDSMQFTYNPASDPDYQLAASQMEQQVTNMMVGRGGLYSSVTASALQSGLTTLQSEYRKQAYDMYVQDRNFTFQMAEQLYNRQDAEFQKAMTLYSAQAGSEETAWNQNMQMSEFEFNQKKEAFDQSYQLAQFAFNQKQSEFEQQLATAKFNADRQDQAASLALQKQQMAISQANASYNRQIAQAKQTQAAAANTLAIMQGEYYELSSEYEKMLNKWESDGYADAEVSAFFGGNLQYIPYDSAITQNYINQANTALAKKQAQILAYAKQTNDGELYLDTLESFQKQSADPQTIAANYAMDYSSAYNTAINMYGATIPGSKETYTWKDIYNTYSSNSNILIADMGTDNYSKLMASLASKATSE